MIEILGYDCDGRELYEFDIIRAIWYSDTDFREETHVDPRQYCIVKTSLGIPYLISVYDLRNKEAINRFEGRSLDSEVSIKIMPIIESVNYEVAFDCDGMCLSIETKSEKAQLVKSLTKKLTK